MLRSNLGASDCTNHFRSSDIQISEEQKGHVLYEIVKSGITFDGTGDLSGWKGGSIWLVDTSMPIADWKPITERKLTAADDLSFS